MKIKDPRKEFEFSTTFKSVANVVTPKEEDQYKAKASLDSLGKLLDIPQEKIDASPDLLYISADLWVGGMANKNDHAITKEDTVELAKQVGHKYLNLEHEEEKIVGALLDYGFREYADDRKFIDKESAADYDKPIVASTAGFVWRSVHPNLADLLVKASDKDDEEYGKASLSWEILFKEFDILEGSQFIDEGTVITDPKEIAKRKPHLKQFKGTGTYNGKRIYTLVKGPKLLLGAGIVQSPAADVEGILTAETKVVKKAEASQEEEIPKKVKKNSKKISQTNKKHVNKIKAMKIKNLEDYEQVLASVSNGDEVDNKTIADLQANFKPLMEKATASAISDAITKASEKFSAEKAELENSIATAATEKAELEAKVSSLEEAKASTDEKLKEVTDRLDQEAQARTFDERMGALAEEYDFEGEADLKKVVATKIKDLDEEAYAAWVADFKVLAGDKTKDAKAKKAKELEDAKEEAVKAKASTDETPEEIEAREKEEATKAIAAAKETAKETVPNSKSTETSSFEDQFAGLKLELK